MFLHFLVNFRLYEVSYSDVSSQSQLSVKDVNKFNNDDLTHCKINRHYSHNSVVAFSSMWVEHLIMISEQQLMHNLQINNLAENSFVMSIMTDIVDMMMQ